MAMLSDRPTFAGVHLFVQDLRRTLEFYALLGLTPSRAGDEFANIDLAEGESLALGTYALTKAYDAAWTPPAGGGTNALQFALPSRDAVDWLYGRITGAGHVGRLAPFDAFWGSRYAEVCDPDGNVVGLQSPADDAHRRPTPQV